MATRQQRREQVVRLVGESPREDAVEQLIHERLGSLPVVVGRRIKAERLGQGLGIRQLARWAGVQHPTIVNIEKERVFPKLDTLIRLATVLGLSVAQLCVEPGEQVWQEREPAAYAQVSGNNGLQRGA